MATTQTYITPELEKDFKLTLKGEDAKDLFLEHSIRNGRYVKDQIAKLIWARHELPMYRGTIIDEVPFILKIDRILFDYQNFGIATSYRFLAA